MLLVLLVLKVLQDLRVLRVQRVQRVLKVLLDLKVHKDQLVLEYGHKIPVQTPVSITHIMSL